MGVAIRTDGLTKTYGKARGITDVSLEVPAGEVFGFLGPNGAGKTTTIRLLLDHIRPTSGRAEVLGFDAQRDPVSIRERIGFLPSDVGLYGRMTGRQVLTYLGNLRGGVEEAERDALVERFGVELDKQIRQLSMGNRQKVALVAAFMHRPELVILDEPTVGLDPLVQQEFHKLINEVRADGRTVFLSSHTLSEVERHADRVGIIREGELIVIDTVESLRAKAVRRLEFEFEQPVPVCEFEALPQVQSVAADGNVVQLTIAGAVGSAVKLAAQHGPVNVISREPDLEELFLAYYQPVAA